jgi:hypothetical protein
MAPNPTCSALASAKEKKGTLYHPLDRSQCIHYHPGLSYAAIATQIGQSEQRVIDSASAQTVIDEHDHN